ncbi:MAG: hypothetical protein ABMA64_27150 [Myxococcota bacterium]
MVAWMVGAASAADLHVQVETAEGLSETHSWASVDTFLRRLGPRTSGKSSVEYVVSAPTSVYDAVDGAYRVELSVCLEWTRKGKSDRWCKKEEVLAPPESAGPNVLTGSIKAKDKFEWTMRLWYTGEPPSTTVPLPPEPVEE